MTSVQYLVTVIIVTFRSRQTIAHTLEVLRSAADDRTVRVIVVDNASPDDTADLVADNFPWVQLIRSTHNVGFGRGCNLGIDQANSPYVLLLNPDATLDKISIQRLVDFMEQHRRVGICGPAVRDTCGTLQPSGPLPTPLKVALKPLLPGWAGRGQRHVAPGDPPMRSDWICGSIMLLRKEMLDVIGAFDPRFFLYYEETDLCFRARQHGWECWTVGEAVGRHINAASAKETNEPMIWGTLSEHYFRSRFYFFSKHYGLIRAIVAEVGEFGSMVLRAILNRMRGKSYPYLRPRLSAPFLKSPRQVIEP
jgi:N-acetylglucosaminyl-diphospho-decaprenol L-rhamnosyltransferase